jgi:hypothetical protein
MRFRWDRLGLNEVARICPNTAGYLDSGTRPTWNDRQSAMTTLTKARAAGCLDLAQYEARLADVEHASTTVRLSEITKDLPRFPEARSKASTRDIIVNAGTHLSNDHRNGYYGTIAVVILSLTFLSYFIPTELIHGLWNEGWCLIPVLTSVAAFFGLLGDIVCWADM